MILFSKNKTILQLTIIYFVVVVACSLVKQNNYPNFSFFLSSIRIPILIVLYYISSTVKSTLYFSALILFFFAFLFFRENTSVSNLIGSVISLIYRLIIFLIVYKSIKNKNWIAITLASIPYVFSYLYIVFLIEHEINFDFYPWVFNGFLTAFIGGIATYDYFFKDEKKSFWLFISAILFTIQIGVFLINKYYISEEILKTTTIILFGISNFTFYKYVIITEEKNKLKDPAN
mgnify:FL=1